MLVLFKPRRWRGEFTISYVFSSYLSKFIVRENFA